MKYTEDVGTGANAFEILEIVKNMGNQAKVISNN